MSDCTNSIGREFKSIQDGTFTVGERDEAHEVTLTQTFKLGVHQVTQFQYEQVKVNSPSVFIGSYNPVDKVSWDDAIEFYRHLSSLPAQKTNGNVYHLPTEAQGEYACRAGTTTNYSSGND
ncbi:SUMF1/EgtB/PvdO family nonheme iron enzyme [bacterium]|nr:SUMF1/EgtB/PvdO family nonheme iron enzyme [bacterium]